MRKVKKDHFSPGDRFLSLFEQKTIRFNLKFYLKYIILHSHKRAKKVVFNSPCIKIKSPKFPKGIFAFKRYVFLIQF